jgi:hypothetical protein
VEKVFIDLTYDNEKRAYFENAVLWLIKASDETLRSVAVILNSSQLVCVEVTLARIDTALGMERTRTSFPGNRVVMSWEGAPEHMKQSVISSKWP